MKIRNGILLMRIPVPCGNEEMEPETSCIPVDGMVFSGNKEENILKPEKKGKKQRKILPEGLIPEKTGYIISEIL